MENSIEELKQRLEELYQTQQARLDVGADDLDIREEIAEAEDEIKELQADINEKNNNGNDTNVGSIGNSIEEDITKINTYVELVLKKDYCNCNELNTILGKHCDGSKNVAYAMQHILSDYKRVLKENEYMHNELNKQQTTINKYAKENEELKNKIMEKELEIIGKEEYTKASMGEIIEQYYTANEDCITKQRIEDIIDRIDYDIKKTKEIISKNTNIYASYRKNDYQIVRLRAMNTKSLDIKKRLQELLESEE